MSRTTFEIPQAKHPFIGLGTGIIITENGREEPRIIIKFPLHNIEIVAARGEEAKAMVNKLNTDESSTEDKTEFVKTLACEIVGIPYLKINSGRRDARAVFARWLVWDYQRKVLKLSLEACGETFDLDHATVIYGMKQLSGENLRYLTGWRAYAYNKFWEAVNSQEQLKG